MTRPVLLVDDDPLMLELMSFELETEGMDHRTAGSGAEALAALQDEGFSAVVLDLHLPDVTGTELLSAVRDEHPELPVIMVTAEGDVRRVVECMQLGAVDFVQKPFERQRFVTSLRNAQMQGELNRRVGLLTRQLRDGDGFTTILGRSRSLRKCTSMLRRAADRDVSVLLTGESGTGKEVAARAVHTESDRASGPFVAINCGAIPEGLIESELFGHERGAFTGAESSRPGCFERAEGGTIFLDEIAELRLDLQVRLLRVLQERNVQRVGGDRERAVNVRVIAATNRDLITEIDAGTFREDLYYRLAVFPVHMPALRERDDDVILLAEHFLQRFTERHARAVNGFSSEALDVLRRYDWPGNVRELENALERAVILEDGELLAAAHLPEEVRANARRTESNGHANGHSNGFANGHANGHSNGHANGHANGHSNGHSNGHAHGHDNGHSDGDANGHALPSSAPLAPEILPFVEEERRILQRALMATNWCIKEAAERLGIGRATMYRKIGRYGLRGE